MDEASQTMLTLMKLVPEIKPSAQPSIELSPTPSGTALKCCSKAWHRAYRASMREEGNEFHAKLEANAAWCNAMPLLTGYEGIRDFIVCVAQGILIGAIPADRSGQLLYAAQVALTILNRQPKPPKSIPA